MPHISKRRLKRKTEEELITSLQIVLTKIGKSEEMNHFLLSLLSKTERIMFAKRLAVVVLIQEDIPELKIANMLNVTRETVNRIKSTLELRGTGYNIAIRKLDEAKLLAGFKKLLLSLARYSIRAAGGYVKPSILD